MLELLALAALTALGFADIQRPLSELVTHPVLLTRRRAAPPRRWR